MKSDKDGTQPSKQREPTSRGSYAISIVLMVISSTSTFLSNLWASSKLGPFFLKLPKAAKVIGDTIDELRIVPRLILVFWLYLSYRAFDILANNLDTLESPALMALGGLLTASLGYCKIYIDGKRHRSSDD